MSFEYSEPELIAELNMLGLVVTPTTADVAIRAGKEWGSDPVIFALDKSSSQMEVGVFFSSSNFILESL